MEWKFWAGMSALYFVLYLSRGALRTLRQKNGEPGVADGSRAKLYRRLILTALSCTLISTAALIGIHVADDETP